MVAVLALVRWDCMVGLREWRGEGVQWGAAVPAPWCLTGGCWWARCRRCPGGSWPSGGAAPLGWASSGPPDSRRHGAERPALNTHTQSHTLTHINTHEHTWTHIQEANTIIHIYIHVHVHHIHSTSHTHSHTSHTFTQIHTFTHSYIHQLVGGNSSASTLYIKIESYHYQSQGWTILHIA